MEQVNSYKFLEISIRETVMDVTHLHLKAQRRLDFLKKLSRGATESILTGNITDRHGMCRQEDEILPRTSLVPVYQPSVISVR